MAQQMTYKDFRERISIQQVASELGYIRNTEKGKTIPAYILKSGGVETDKFYVDERKNEDKALFWRRNPGPGKLKYGDVIALIRENIRMFPEYAGARNEIDAVNKVCQRLANTVFIESGEEQGRTEGKDKIRNFNITEYDRIHGDWNKAMRFFIPRGIDAETARLFKDTYELVRDNTNDKSHWHNLGFPFRRPGEKDIVGYDIRGFNKYRIKAAGTDSSMACWQAYLGKDGTNDNIPSWQIEKIHFAESPYDMMSYVQLNRGRINFENELFVSLGGTFTNVLIARLFEVYPNAGAVLHFDNDATGIMYDIRVAAIKTGKVVRSTAVEGGTMVRFHFGEKAFSLPTEKISFDAFCKAAGLVNDRRPDIKIEKPPQEFKDWNEILQTAHQAEKEQRKYVKPEKEYGTYRNPAQNPEDIPPRSPKR